jgi:hypothetical protein
MTEDILIVGDIHGDWKYLNKLISKHHPYIILQCGDFGWWPHFHNKTGLLPKKKKFNQFGIKNHDTKIFWIGGNHENWDDLSCITDYESIEIQDNITYCPFGTVIGLNGYSILMCGGAESTDREWRTEGIDWWRNEIISQEDMDNLPDCNIDIIISHTLPRNWIDNIGWKWTNRDRDPSSFALQLIFEKYKPKKWFAGHFHHYLNCKIDGCELTVLSMPGVHDQWWVKL